MSDIQFRADEGMFNCRVVGICIKNNKILLSRMKQDDFWTFIGGKAEFGESTDEAIVREFREETGAALRTERLLAVIENFFEFGGKDWHQYIFFYELRDEHGALEYFEGERQIADEADAVYRWFELSELEQVNIKPDCSKAVMENRSGHILHYINRD